MKHTTINDNNYPTIESLADSSGSLNAAISKTDEFKKLKAFEKLMNATKELDVFDGILPKHRFLFYINDMKLEKCVVCEKPFVYFKQAQKRFSLCRHKQILNRTEYAESLKRAKSEKYEEFIRGLADKNLLISETEYRKILNKLTNASDNYAFIVTKDEYSHFYHDLIIRTEHALQINPENLEIPQRIFIEANNIQTAPVCGYCGKPVPFINRKRGYDVSCRECSNKKSNDTRANTCAARINSTFDFSKYEIIKYPKLFNAEPLVIKCKKCGHESEWIVNNGMASRLNEIPMCKHCEYRANWEETEFYEYISSIYDGEIIHGKGSRKIIPPYELDIYLPDLKLAFEYDGVYWHNDLIKEGRNYHLRKTEKCAESGIRLVHVFSSDWILNKNITKSRIKNLLGIYDRKIFARKCHVETVSNTLSREFQRANHLQGPINAKVNLGLFFNNELVALMTFGKCRFDKKHEWEMLRFCCKLGYHIPGAAGKLLKHFEKIYKPKSLVSYADRRWSQGELYNALGFEFVKNSPPNYWYFKTRTNILLSRINFQKHKLANVLDNYDPLKSEAKNMKANGYFRIFDCGNMVFEKTYCVNEKAG